MTAWGTPVPIPNTEVKPASANGIASPRCERVGSCQDFDIKIKLEEAKGLKLKKNDIIFWL